MISFSNVGGKLKTLDESSILIIWDVMLFETHVIVCNFCPLCNYYGIFFETFLVISFFFAWKICQKNPYFSWKIFSSFSPYENWLPLGHRQTPFRRNFEFNQTQEILNSSEISGKFITVPNKTSIQYSRWFSSSFLKGPN